MGRVISRGPKNFFAWNEEIDRDPPWLQVRATVPSIVSTSPDGRSKGNVIHEDNSAGITHLIRYTRALTFGQTFTMSGYVAPLNRDWIRLIAELTGGNEGAYFDVTNGVIGTITANILEARMRVVDSGFYQIWIVFQSLQNNNIGFSYRIASGNNGESFNGLDQDSLAVWRPKINPGWGPDPDILTQEVPRT